MSSQLDTRYALVRQPDGLRPSTLAGPARPANSASTPPPKKNDRPTVPNLLGAPQQRPPKQRGARPLSFPAFWRTAAEPDPDAGSPDSPLPEARSASSTRTSRNRTHQPTLLNSQPRRPADEANEAGLPFMEVDLDPTGVRLDGAERVRTADGSDGGRPQQDRPPLQGGRTRRMGYYRLYCPSGAISSVDPMSENDRSLSSFDIEHVPPPRLARNYIAYISHRERLNPSGVNMYLTPEQGSPELVTNLDTVIVMDVEANEISRRRYPSPVALRAIPQLNSNSKLPIAFYRLYGVAATSSGAQRPMSSRGPIYETDPSLASFFIDYVPPPLRAKDYIAYICELEGIHPSRVTLYLRTKAVREEGSRAAEAQEVQSDEDIITARTASFTSENNPIMVNVELEVGAYGDVDLDTKSTPLPILSAKVLVRKLNKSLSKWQNRYSAVY